MAEKSGISEATQPMRPSNGFERFVPLSHADDLIEPDAAVESSVLCTKCRAFASDLQAMHEIDADDRIFNHYDTGAQLQTSYLSGCHLCTLIWQSFEGKHPTPTQCPKSGPRRQVEAPITHLSDARSITISYYGGNCLWINARLSEKASLRGQLNLVSCTPRSLPLGLTTSSRSSWNRAVDWIAECLQTHELCKQRTSTERFHPTRLIDVESLENPNEVRLVNSSTDEVSGDYVALSYRWGVSSALQLTSATLGPFRTGVSTDQLPQTVQDAILIARRLKIKYLWVDALCIVQDSPDDWAQEAASMSDVYQHCLLTIAALGAAHSGEGLFSKRDPLLLLPCELFSTADGELIGARSWRTTICDPVPAFSESPLHSRGWVVQEHILSPRTLSFGVSLFYDCRMGAHEEWEGSVISDGWRVTERLERATYKGRIWQWISECRRTDLDTEKHRAAFWALWCQIVALYTKSALTISKDRPIALQGVIEAVKSATGWAYTSGIWLPFKLESLLWQIAFECRRAVEWLRVPVADTPTWSWEHSTIPIHVVHGDPPTDYTRGVPLAMVIEINTSKSSHQYIIIKGELVNIKKFSFESERGFFGVESRMAFESGSMAGDEEKAWLDSDHHDPTNAFYFLPLLATFAGGVSFQEIHGLLLAESPLEPDAYVRVGKGICLRKMERDICRYWAAAATIHIKIF